MALGYGPSDERHPARPQDAEPSIHDWGEIGHCGFFVLRDLITLSVKTKETTMPKLTIPLACSICHLPCEPWHPGSTGYGHNAWPINEGRCCNACNALKVIPARIAMLPKAHDPHD